MPTLYTNIDSNRRKTWALIFGFVLLIIAVGYAFYYVTGNPDWIFIAAVVAIFQPVISYWFSDKIVLSMSKAQAIDKQQAPEIYRLVENLSIAAGLPMPKVYIIDDTAPNAFATGRDAEHAAIAVTTGLLSKLNKRELDGVLAHEMSHIGNRDILIMTIVSVLVGVIVLLADWFTRSMFWGRGRRDDREGGGNAVMMIVGLALIILAPLFAKLMQMALSRKREFIADSSGALLTRDPEGLASALQKISHDREPLEVANRATAHLYIASPFKSDADDPSFIQKAFMTHPPIKDRVAALMNMDVK